MAYKIPGNLSGPLRWQLIDSIMANPIKPTGALKQYHLADDEDIIQTPKTKRPGYSTDNRTSKIRKRK